MAGRGRAWRGKDLLWDQILPRPGEARPGKARRGKARQGVRLLWDQIKLVARQGAAWRGVAGLGKARWLLNQQNAWPGRPSGTCRS